ncbi:DMT family transporter [Compostibacter hankyongensis]|uniref:Drug/metabolite exporter YedA n=1 Tax=Compostibacter hankyongensis TaxID=1007089 RepID=A0ABP8FLJ6_9BACT
MPLSEKSKAFIAVGLVSFFWGTTYLGIRIGVKYMPGLQLTAIRQFTAGAMVVGWFLAKGHRMPSPGELWKLAVMGLLLLGVGNGLLSWGEQYIPSGLAAIIAALSPLAIALFSMLLLKGTRLTPRILAGLLLGLAGVIVIFYNRIKSPAGNTFLPGIALCLLAVTGWGWGSVFIARHKLKLDVLYATGWQMLLAGILLFPASYLSGQAVPLQEIAVNGWMAVLYLIFFGSLVGYVAYVYALSKLPPTRVSIYAYINPIVAILLGWQVLDESLSLSMAAGSAVALAGIYLVNSGFKKQIAAKK